MSSTRNINTPGDYDLEQWKYKQNLEYNTYIHSSYGIQDKTYFAGDGLIMGRIPSTQLSINYTDVESKLFGINSTNLVSPRPEVTPKIKELKSLSIIDKIPVILPDPIVIEPNQRFRFA
jgi:hypothetical protein